MANETRTLIKDIRKRQLNFFGHILRKEQIEHIVITGKISGRRDWETTGEDFGWSGKLAGREVNHGNDK
jgi:hypothetical protein